MRRLTRRIRPAAEAALALFAAALAACTDRPPPLAPAAAPGAATPYVATSGPSWYGQGDIEIRSRVLPRLEDRQTRCLDVQGNRRDPGAPLTVYTCLDDEQQTFRWDAAGGTIRVYEGTGAALCVDAGREPSEGGPVYTWTCHGGPPQRWTHYGDDHIRLEGSNLCLDVPGNRETELGAPLRLWTCLGTSTDRVLTQEWDVLRVRSRGPAAGVRAGYGTGRDVEFRSAVAEDRCLDVEGASRTRGAPLTIHSCLTATQQTFAWDPATGLLRVYVDGDAAGVLCVDGGGDPRQEGPVYTWTCHGGPQQQWEPTADGTGLRLRAYPARNLCLDVPGGTSAPGTRLWLWGCYSGTAQRWTANPILYAIPMDGRQPTPNTGSDTTNGRGEARFSLHSATGTVCAAAWVEYDRNNPNFADADEAHIHPAPRNFGSPAEIGDWNDNAPLIDGFNSASGAGRGAGRECVPVGRATVHRLLDDPAGFYFNVHSHINRVANGGIVRGQLGTRPPT
jgi:hypothetical protein